MKPRADGKPAFDERWIWLALLVFVVFLQRGALSSPLLPMSDYPHALGTPGVRTWKNLRFLFSPSYLEVFWEGSYHPLYTFLTIVNYSLFGFDPIGFRVLKVVVLWLNAVLLSKVCRKELGAWSWAAALIYVLAPCHLSTSMLDMKDELVAFFCLLGLSLHRRSGVRGYPPAFGCAVAACGALALAAKETGVVFPALLFSMDVCRGAVPREASVRRRWIGGYLLCGGATFLYALFRFIVIPAGGLGYAATAHVGAVVARLQGYAAQLIGLESESARRWIFPVDVLLAAYTIRLASEDRRKFSWACLAWIVLGFLPVSGLLPIRPLSNYLSGPDASVRYQILPGVGYAWLLSLGLRESLGRKKWVLAAPFLVLLVPLLHEGRRSPFQRADYGISGCSREGGRIKSGENCVNSIIEPLVSLPFMSRRFPAARSQYTASLGSLLGARASAVEDYFGGMLPDPCRAARVLPHLNSGDFEEIWRAAQADIDVGRSRQFLRGGDAPRALAASQEALRLDPGYSGAHLETAAADWQLGRWSEAVAEYETYRSLARDLRSRDARLDNPLCREPQDRASGILIESVVQYSRSASAESEGSKRAALRCLEHLTGLSPADAERYLAVGAAGVRGSGGAKEWPSFARRASAGAVADDETTLFCADYDRVGEADVPPPPAKTALAPEWLKAARYDLEAEGPQTALMDHVVLAELSVRPEAQKFIELDQALGNSDREGVRRLAFIFREAVGDGALDVVDRLRGGPEEADVLMDLASRAAGSGRRRQALDGLNFAAGLSLDSERLRRLRLAYEGLGESGLAAEIARRAEDDAVGWLDRAESAAAAGDRKSALAAAGRARKLTLVDDDARRLVLVEQELGEYAQGLEIANLRVRARPDDARWRSDRGVLQALAGKREAAAADWKAAIALDPDLVAPYLSLGSFYVSTHRREDAAALYKNALLRPLIARNVTAARRLRSELKELSP